MSNDGKRLDIAKVLSGKVLTASNTLELTVLDTHGRTQALTVPTEALMGLVQHLTEASDIINRRLHGSPEIAPVSGFRLLPLMRKERLGLEVAFGRHGRMYFAMPRETAATLGQALLREAAKPVPPGPSGPLQ